MNSVEIANSDARIIADAAVSNHAETGWFDPAWWQQQGLLRRSAPGRGSAWFVGRPPDRWVLRRYLRGGMARHLSADHYFFTGWQHTRAFSEYRILGELHHEGLPVPKPIGACVWRSGLLYTAALLLEELPATDTLADCLERSRLQPEQWRAVGEAIARLHQAGIWHADLNARNILLGDRVYLIDFDRAVRKTGSVWQQGNLQRLRRSLDKFAANSAAFHFTEQGWQQLLAGYNDA